MVKLTGLSCGVLFEDLHEALDNPSRKTFQRLCDWYEKLGIIPVHPQVVCVCV